MKFQSAAWTVVLMALGAQPSSAWIPQQQQKQSSSQSLRYGARTSTQSTTALYASTATQPSSSSSDSTINPLVASIKPSKTVEIFSLVKQMQADGIEVTSLCVGEPDFLPPQAVLDAVVEAVKNGETRYTAVTGTLELRQAIANDLKQRKQVQYDPKTEIVVGNGAKQCVYQAILALAGQEDKVLVPAPYWPSYPEMVSLAGAVPVILETHAQDGFLMTPESLRAALTAHPETKLLILCNPSNPTGGVYNETQLQQICAVLQEFPHVYVVADEIYERLVYDGDCPSMAAQPGMFDRTLTINGFSKSYAMTGMRLGYLAAPAALAKAVTTIQSQLTSCAGSISQAAGVAALTKVTEEEMDKNVEIMKEKRDYVLDRLAKMDSVIVKVPPNGAFYVLPDVSAYGDDAELCLSLLKEEQLALVPGSSFGAPGTVRISYATSMEELATAMDKLENFLKNNKK